MREKTGIRQLLPSGAHRSTVVSVRPSICTSALPQFGPSLANSVTPLPVNVYFTRDSSLSVEESVPPYACALPVA